jgi:acyl carrier protein
MDMLATQLRKFIVDNFLFGVESPRFAFSDDDSFQARGIVDSTGILELVCHLQERYGINIEDDELVPDNLDSINRVVSFITRKQCEQPEVIVRAS